MFTKPRIIIVLLYSICITYSQNYRNVDEIKDDLRKSNEDIRAFIRYSTPKQGEPAKY